MVSEAEWSEPMRTPVPAVTASLHQPCTNVASPPSSSSPPPDSSSNPAQLPLSSSAGPPHLSPVPRTSSSQPTQHRPPPPLLPAGLKVFINIAWDAHVPPPPAGSEDIIQRAMLGMDEDEYDAAQPEEGGYYVPVVVSPPREDTDKKGARALVLDAVLHTSVKGRATRDEAFKAFVVELALQRIEAQSHAGGLQLSRQIGTPNLASKGALAPRRVQIPSALFAAAASAAPDAPDALNITGAAGKAKGKKLIEEVEVEVPPNSKGILKGEPNNGTAKAKTKTNVKGILKPAPAPPKDAGPTTPRWSWAKAETRIKITIAVPLLTHAHIPTATLDLEPRRVLFAVPGLYALDVPLDAPDAELVAASAHLDSDGTTTATAGGGGWETGALGLKRARDLDVEGARAEWRVEEGCLVVFPQLASIGYMVHTIPTAPTPSAAPANTVSTDADALICYGTGPPHAAGSVSVVNAARM
ncbi:hypothetical protein FIBSPDRAFT_1053288 [Athelia psychrophila]|uniref:PIH1 N-terminal domain-containing protein n=1 Tax=Athelia psychrophila TaxID=1759441 RepID=A0A167X6P9_9AGAM|nr:hypothetical protein FIBSPDRAFT_1053288 [Fibularhizoctonia sp. CBS 109695]